MSRWDTDECLELFANAVDKYEEHLDAHDYRALLDFMMEVISERMKEWDRQHGA